MFYVCAEGIKGCIADHYDEMADISVNLEQSDVAPVLKAAADNELADIDAIDALPVMMEAENVALIVLKTGAPNQHPVYTGI